MSSSEENDDTFPSDFIPIPAHSRSPQTEDAATVASAKPRRAASLTELITKGSLKDAVSSMLRSESVSSISSRMSEGLNIPKISLEDSIGLIESLIEIIETWRRSSSKSGKFAFEWVLYFGRIYESYNLIPLFVYD
eukprot:UN04484